MAEYMYTWLSTGESHRGAVRKLNEDAYLERPDLGLWLVADGMGGHHGGNIASNLIVDELNKMADHNFKDRFELLSWLHRSIDSANTELRNLAKSRYKGGVVGSTVVALLLDQNGYTLTWAGDSRAYLLRDRLLTQITKDHSQVNDLVDSGVINEEEAEAHPLANVITRAVGADDTIEMETMHGEFQNEDIFMLCSDGINKELVDLEIAELLVNGSLMESRRALIYSALVRKARDNVTVVLVKVNKKVVAEYCDTTIPC
ncbi:PP2C family protein-serine/threonine phosphatase [Aliikangiella maris]|uniref:Protein phosphatase 2C domain-containing protein n=2 Tax=Aliikangiella maris TaxID=3162458 RepID=A0ABV3MN96_9GAMM